MAKIFKPFKRAYSAVRTAVRNTVRGLGRTNNNEDERRRTIASWGDNPGDENRRDLLRVSTAATVGVVEDVDLPQRPLEPRPVTRLPTMVSEEMSEEEPKDVELASNRATLWVEGEDEDD